MKLARKHIMAAIEGAMSKNAHHAVHVGDVTYHAVTVPIDLSTTTVKKTTTGIKIWFDNARDDVQKALGGGALITK